MRKLTLAIALSAILAVPAFASVQNIKVSGSIDTSFIHRKDFNFGRVTNAGGGPLDDLEQDVFITQTILNVSADLTDNVSTTVGLINERAWDVADGSTTDIDLYLAYATLREMLYSPLTVVIGRQAFHYGNSFLVDSAGTNNSAPVDSGIASVAGDLTKQTTLDAVRAIFDYNPLTLELLWAKLNGGIVAQSDGDNADDDVDLYGVDALYELGDAMNTQVEGYFFARINKNVMSGSSLAGKSDKLFVPGLRISTNPIEGLNLQAEGAFQTGTVIATTSNAFNAMDREAYGVQFIANYQVPVLEQYKPVAQYVYTYVSGDESSTTTLETYNQASSETYTGWDPLLENQAGGKIYNSLFSLTNAHLHMASLQVNPVEDVTLKFSGTGIWVDEDIDCGDSTGLPGAGSSAVSCAFSLINPDGTSRTVTVERNADDKTDVGYELDLDATYDYTEDVQIGASFGIFVPGQLFTNDNNEPATQAIAHINVNF